MRWKGGPSMLDLRLQALDLSRFRCRLKTVIDFLQDIWMVRKKHISLQQNNKDRNNMDIVALTIIAIMSIISGIAAIAVLIDMYNTHKTKTA